MNKIISISGEPASGKSTTIKEIKRELEEKGYKVKVLSVGQIFCTETPAQSGTNKKIG